VPSSSRATIFNSFISADSPLDANLDSSLAGLGRHRQVCKSVIMKFTGVCVCVRACVVRARTRVRARAA
jgi:hypothetical protein